MIDWSQKTVLVTGGAGFIGSHLAERLVELGATTRVFDLYNSLNSCGWLDGSERRGDIEVHLGDLRDRDSMKAAFKGVDVVFHLGALIAIPYSYHAPDSYIQTNVQGTMNVLQCARDFEVSRVVHTSTSEVYGSAQTVPISESHPLCGQSPYSASKIGGDMMAEAFYRSFDVPVATLRPFNTYGPRQSNRAVIPTIITQALTTDVIRLGNLAPTRDFNFVADTVEGFLKLAACDAALGRTVNLGTGKEISIGDLVDVIARNIGREVQVECQSERLRPDLSEVDRLCCDNTQIKELVGWEPQVSLEDGIIKTIAWLDENISRYETSKYVV